MPPDVCSIKPEARNFDDEDGALGQVEKLRVQELRPEDERSVEEGGGVGEMGA